MELSRVESKSFEILVEDLGGKLKGCIWERSKDISSWIRFGEIKESRKYRLERCLNEVRSREIEKPWSSPSRRLKGNQSSKGFVDGEGGLEGFVEREGDGDFPSETERVLAKGKRSIKENFIILDRWNLKVGCPCKDPIANEAWVRVVGLPLHLWSHEVFNRIGDGCGDFVAVNEDTISLSELQWARILVKREEKDLPNSAHVVVGSGCYSFHLWWESPPWFTQVVLAGRIYREGGLRVEEEDGGTSHVVCCGSQREKVKQLSLQLEVQDVSFVGGNPLTLPIEVYGIETDVRGRVGISAGLGRKGLRTIKEAASGLGPSLKAHRPNWFERLQRGDDGAQSEISISKVRDVNRDDNPLVEMTRVVMPLETLEVVERVSMSDEALSEELPGGSFDGLASVNDGDKQIPLSIILAKDSTGEMASEGEKTMAGEGVGVSLRSCYRIWKGKAIDEMITV
ncbi:hypothetical protein CK203_067277 [Vitis vinifera]|uniref:Uncharacterized protein n=1 Tax=Vitis vinifera TaxID=29760 RepID=A0A438EFI2_VITVI|nr:hypothetical protein CK203_067277 [Vitis vinifera]